MPKETKLQIVHDPLENKGSAFTEKERKDKKIRGLIPTRVETMEVFITNNLFPAFYLLSDSAFPSSGAV